MSRSKMTLIGYSEYLDAVSVDLFEGFSDLPSGIDKETLVDNILIYGGEFEVLYGDPYLTKAAIETWVKRWYRTFDKWVKALSLEYDPIYNYDRNEEYTEYHTGTVTDDGGGSHNNTTNTSHTRNLSSVTDSSSRAETVGEHSGENNDNTTTKVSAYDATDFSNRDLVTGIGTDHSEDTTTTTGTGRNTQTDTGSSADSENASGWTKSDNTRTNNLQDVRRGRVYGNIGVTTSQAMLQSELDIAYWNLYEHITDLFLKEFVVMVYE